jgi:hypothetical protein
MSKSEMNDQPKSIWRREILPDLVIFRWPERFLRWLFSWRGLRRILIVLAWAATIIALFYGEEHWRGRRAWNNYRQGLEARGEQLDLKAFIPKAVPEEQNFAATPFVQSWFVRRTNAEDGRNDNDPWKDNYSQAAEMVDDGKRDQSRRHFADLVALEMAFDAMRSGKSDSHQRFQSDNRDLESRAKAAPAVLEGLRDREAPLEELRAASRRPYSRYPVVYDLENPWGILLPHLASVKASCSRLELRACAELAAGKSDRALNDVKLMFCLADSLKDEPFLISYLVRLSCFHLVTQTVWEGLAEHRWSEAALEELEARFQPCDLLADRGRPFAAERAAGVLTVDLLARGKYTLSCLGGADENGPRVPTEVEDQIGKLIPGGWYFLEQLNYCKLYQMELGGTFDPANKRISPSQIESSNHQLEREFSGGHFGRRWGLIIQHRLVAVLLLPALKNVTCKCAQAQTAVDEAALACALERFRLAAGQFPEQLEAVVPRFISRLPNDPLAGEPYKYRRTNGGRFVLYSVGWNEKDDGGVPGKTLFDDKQGDWVWEYPTK